MAKQQGISLNRFFLWSITEKVTELKSSLNDPRFPHITYRRGSSGVPTPVIRGTGIFVLTPVYLKLIILLDTMLSETIAEEWIGQVRWLSDWKR